MNINFLIIITGLILLASFILHINNKKNSKKIFDSQTSNNTISKAHIDVKDENDLKVNKIKKSKLINFNPDILVEKYQENDESNVTKDEFDALHHMSLNELKTK